MGISTLLTISYSASGIRNRRILNKVNEQTICFRASHQSIHCCKKASRNSLFSDSNLCLHASEIDVSGKWAHVDQL